MKMTGTQQIAAPRETVWERLNDAETLKACIPGCEELTGSPKDGFEATVKQKIGPVRATFHGAVEITDVVPAQSYRIAGSGKGGVAGYASGEADVVLSEGEDGGTALTYVVNATLGGKLAQLGSRLIDSVAKKMADQFFTRFKEEVEGTGE